MFEDFQNVTGTFFNVSITIVHGLKNVSLKVWEELITQSSAVYSKHAGKMTKFNYV